MLAADASLISVYSGRKGKGSGGKFASTSLFSSSAYLKHLLVMHVRFVIANTGLFLRDTNSGGGTLSKQGRFKA